MTFKGNQKLKWFMTIWEDWEDMLKLSATNKDHNNKKKKKRMLLRDPMREAEEH